MYMYIHIHIHMHTFLHANRLSKKPLNLITPSMQIDYNALLTKRHYCMMTVILTHWTKWRSCSRRHTYRIFSNEIFHIRIRTSSNYVLNGWIESIGSANEWHGCWSTASHQLEQCWPSSLTRIYMSITWCIQEKYHSTFIHACKCSLR